MVISLIIQKILKFNYLYLQLNYKYLHLVIPKDYN